MLLESRLTIASYPGGKSDKKKHQPLFQAVPLDISYLIEPFAGLANFFLVVSPRVKQVWLNDKDNLSKAWIFVQSAMKAGEYDEAIEAFSSFVNSIKNQTNSPNSKKPLSKIGGKKCWSKFCQRTALRL